MSVLLSREQRTNWKKWSATNREVTETLVMAVQRGAPPEVLAAVQTGGVDLGSQMTGRPLTEALGKNLPGHKSIRSSMLLLGWHQLVGTRQADNEADAVLLDQGLLGPGDLPYVVGDPDRRTQAIESYVSFTDADRELIVDATMRFLELAHGTKDLATGNYANWRYRVVRGMLTGADWHKDNFMEIADGSGFAAVLFADLRAFFNHLLVSNQIVADSVDATALCRYWFNFVAERNALT